MHDAAALFFNQSALDPVRTQQQVNRMLHGLDDGELFLEFTQSENIVFDDGRVKQAGFNTAQGFGLRGVHGESTSLAHSCELTPEALERAGETVRTVHYGQDGAASVTDAAFGTN